MKKKCDVIIPVYNAPDWVKLCVYSLFTNTPPELLGNVFLMDDASDQITKNLLKNLRKKHGSKIKVVTNKENLGFVKNVNKGLALCSSDYILLLNSDCIVAKNTIGKLMGHMEKDKRIGLISPLSNNAANLSLEIFEGFSYMKMDALLESKFKGKVFDACTIVGNCLMITKECIEKTGKLDESYGLGYGEETDYQFLAMSEGFTAKVAVDTYVYHKAEVSFGNSSEKQKRVDKNRELFFSRWGDEYETAMQKYVENDPIKYVQSLITEEDKEISLETLFYLPEIHQSAGGTHVVVNLVNKFLINGHESNILYEVNHDYKEQMLFVPIKLTLDVDFDIKRIISTIWDSAFRAYELAKKKRVPLINFIQGYENYFENGLHYRSVELTHRLADYEITISTYLQNKIKDIFGKDLYLVRNGINYDLIQRENKREKVKNIAFVLRGNVMKGDYILMDVMKELDNKYSGLVFNILCINEDVELPSVENNKMNITYGVVPNLELIKLLQESDIYVDASVNEGFGLIGLEAMASGCVPVMSNSFGILDYMEDGKTGYVIDKVNNSTEYFEKIESLIKNSEVWNTMKDYNQSKVKDFDYDETIAKFFVIFENEKATSHKERTFTKEEKKLIKNRHKSLNVPYVSKGLSVIKVINRFVPNFIRKILKKFGNWLYHLYDHN